MVLSLETEVEVLKRKIDNHKIIEKPKERVLETVKVKQKEAQEKVSNELCSFSNLMQLLKLVAKHHNNKYDRKYEEDSIINNEVVKIKKEKDQEKKNLILYLGSQCIVSFLKKKNRGKVNKKSKKII